MALGFRRSFRIAPGWRMNVSKSGVSTSIGTRGAWFTVGPRGTRTTVGLPGTGISYTSQSSRRRDRVEQAPADAVDPVMAAIDFFRGLAAVIVVMLVIGFIVKTFVA